MMRALVILLLALTSCILVAQPRDLIGGHPYCEPIHQDVWMCRDDYARQWRCVWQGHWECRRTTW